MEPHRNGKQQEGLEKAGGQKLGIWCHKTERQMKEFVKWSINLKKPTEEDGVSPGVKFLLERKQSGGRANLLRDGHHTSICWKYPFKTLSRIPVSVLGTFCSRGLFECFDVCCRATRHLLGDSSGGHSEGGVSHRVRLGTAVPGAAGAPSAVKTDH